MSPKLLALFIICFVAAFFVTASGAEENFQKKSEMGIFSDGKEVGYTKTLITQSGSIVSVNEKSEVKVTLLGKPDTVETEAEYRLDGFTLKSFIFDMNSDAAKISLSGRVEKGRIKASLETPSGDTDLELKSEEEFMIFALLPKFLSQHEMEVGNEYRVLLFEPSIVLLGAKAEDLMSVSKVEAEEVVHTNKAGDLKTFKVITDYMGSRYTTWITPGGEVIKQLLPAGLTALRRESGSAKRGKLSSFDVMEKTSIPSNKKIKKPRELNYMKAKITGIDNLDHTAIDDGYSQNVTENIVEIKRAIIADPGYELPYTEGSEAPLTLPSHLIQSDDEAIVKKTHEITKGESDPEKAASKINDWVYEYLKKEGTVSLPSALDVLKSGKGDCNEHAVLFAALARAAGIPTKLVMGTIYIDGRFYYHAWNEVYLGSWVPVDPTYGQFPADATHVKLTQGDLKKSAEIMKVVGTIKIEILDAS